MWTRRCKTPASFLLLFRIGTERGAAFPIQGSVTRAASANQSVTRELMAQSPKTGLGAWGFAVKQGATTIHEDSTTYTVLVTCSFTVGVEAVTHALLWTALRADSQTTHAVILTDSMSFAQKVKWKPRLACLNLRHPPSKTPVNVLPGACRREGTWRENRLPQVSCVSGNLIW